MERKQNNILLFRLPLLIKIRNASHSLLLSWWFSRVLFRRCERSHTHAHTLTHALTHTLTCVQIYVEKSEEKNTAGEIPKILSAIKHSIGSVLKILQTSYRLQHWHESINTHTHIFGVHGVKDFTDKLLTRHATLTGSETNLSGIRNLLENCRKLSTQQTIVCESTSTFRSDEWHSEMLHSAKNWQVCVHI